MWLAALSREVPVRIAQLQLYTVVQWSHLHLLWQACVFPHPCICPWPPPSHPTLVCMLQLEMEWSTYLFFLFIHGLEGGRWTRGKWLGA